MMSVVVSFLLLCCLTALPGYTELVSDWRFDEGAGTVADDSKGINSGTLKNGPTWVADRNGNPGQALYFDGIDDYVCMEENDESLRITGDLTIEVWIKPESLKSSYQQIVRLGTSGASTPYVLALASHQVTTRSHAPKWCIPIETENNPISVGEWYHIVLTRKYLGETGTYKIYINGRLNKETVRDGVALAGKEPLTIGSGTGFPHYFSGTIDRVRIYDNACSAEDVKALYNEPKPPKKTGIREVYL